MAAGSAPADSTASGFEALRAGAAVSALDDRAALVVSGEDRTSFLQGMLSNEVAALAPGAGTRALLLTEQGRVVADLRVYVFEDVVRIDAPADARSEVRAALEKFVVADDVEFEDTADAGLALRGPGATAVLGAAGVPDAADREEGAHWPVEIAGVPARLSRADDLGVAGFHLWCEPSGRDTLRRALEEAGAESVEAEVLEIQRVVAGVGRLGSEFGRETLAPEAPSLEPAISHQKGCYLGQEVVERIASRGHINWRVVPVRTKAPIAVGDVVRSDENEVGRVTSVARRPDDGSFWGLARLRAARSDAGTELTIANGAGDHAAEVVAPAPK